MLKRKGLAITAIMLAFLMFSASALAAVEIIGDDVFANGHEVTIYKHEDSGETRIKSNEADAVSEDTGKTDIKGKTVYGGSKAKDIASDTSVTMESGDVKAIYGGGKNGDTGDTHVTIEGGTVGTVFGGGHAEGSIEEAYTGDRHINIEGGTVSGDVYGGGHAKTEPNGGGTNVSSNKDTHILIEGGTIGGDVYAGGKAEAPSAHPYSGGANADISGNTIIEVKDGVLPLSKVKLTGKATGWSTLANVSGSKEVKVFKPITVTTHFVVNGETVASTVNAKKVYQGEELTISPSSNIPAAYSEYIFTLPSSKTLSFEDAEDVVFYRLGTAPEGGENPGGGEEPGGEIPLGPGEQKIPLGAPRTGGAGLGLIYGLVSMLGLAGAFCIKAKKR